MNDWQKNNRFVGNFFSSADTKDACNGLVSLLYKTDNFGSIRNTTQGIELTEKASLTTIAVALILAAETMNHKPLIIFGSNYLNAETLSPMPDVRWDFSQHFAESHVEYINSEKVFESRGGCIFNSHYLPK